MWFDAATGNMLGAILGSLIGILGGTWGAVAGVSAPKCKRRGMVLHSGKCLLVLGALSLAIGLAALASGQPRHVWYSFVLIGAIVSVSLVPVYAVVKRAYVRAELKKMSIDDLQ